MTPPQASEAAVGGRAMTAQAGAVAAAERSAIRARMKDNLVPRFQEFFPDCAIDAEWEAFLVGIQGQEVTLVFTSGDAFEEADNNFWLPDCMWDELTQLIKERSNG